MAVLVSNIPPCHISAPGTLVSPSSPASLDLAIVHDATDYASTPRALVGGLDLVAALEPLSEPVLEPTSSSEYCLISHKRPHDDSEDDVLDLAPQQKRWRQDDSVITNVIQDPFFTHSWGHTQFYPTGSDFLATPESQDAAAIAAILNLPSFDQALNASSQPNTGISFSPADVPAPEPCEWPPSFEMDMARGPSSPVMMAPTNDADVFQPQQTSQQQQQQQQHIMCEDQDAVGEPESASKPVLDPVIEPQPEPESGNNNSNENVRPRHEPSLWIRACKSRLALLQAVYSEDTFRQRIRENLASVYGYGYGHGYSSSSSSTSPRRPSPLATSEPITPPSSEENLRVEICTPSDFDSDQGESQGSNSEVITSEVVSSAMPEEEEEIEFGGIADESFVCGSSSGNTSLESNISLESNSSVDTSSSSTSSSDSSSSIDEHDNLLDTTFAFDHWSSDDDSEDDDLDMDSDDDLFDSEGEDTLTSPHEQLVFFPPASSASSSSSPSSPSSSSPSSQSSSSSTQANSTSPFRRRPPRNPFWLHTPPPTPDPILSQLPLPKLSDVPAWAVQCYCVPPLMRGTPPRNWEEGSFGDLRMLRGRGGGYGEGSGERYGEEGVAS